MLYSPIQVSASYQTPYNPGVEPDVSGRCEPWRGCHQGREFHLLRNEKKPMALLDMHQIIPLRQYLGPLARQFRLFVRNDDRVRPHRMVLVCRKDQIARISMFERANHAFFEGRITFAERDARWGLLLGYTHADILAFVNEDGKDRDRLWTEPRHYTFHEIPRWTHLRLRQLMEAADYRRRPLLAA